MTQSKVQPGQTYTLAGTLGATGTIAAYGALLPTTPGGLVAIQASATNNGTIAIQGSTNGGSAGALQDTGTLVNNEAINLSGGQATETYSGIGASATVAGTLTNTGRLHLFGGFSNRPENHTASGATLTNTGVLTNSGSLTIDGSYRYAAGLPATGGLLVDTGGLFNAGVLTVTGGNGSGVYFAAYAHTGGGQLVIAGQAANGGQLTVGGGRYAGAGGTLTDNGVLTNTGTIEVKAGYSSYFYPNLEADGGAVNVTGVLHNAGLIKIDAGFFRRDEFGYEINGKNATFTVNGLLTNSGTILTGYNRYYTGSKITVAPGATLINAGYIGGDGVLVNNGVIGSGGHGATSGTIATQGILFGHPNCGFVNNSLVRIAPDSAFTVNAPVIGTHGVFDIYAHGTLTFTQPVASTQQITIAGDHTTLALADVHYFAAVISNLAPRTTIDFLTLQVTSVTASGSSLHITATGSPDLTLALAAPLPPNTQFQLTKDGNTGTDLNVIHSTAASAEPLGLKLPPAAGQHVFIHPA